MNCASIKNEIEIVLTAMFVKNWLINIYQGLMDKNLAA